MTPTPPPAIRLLVLVASGLTLVSAATLFVVAVTHRPPPWFFLGFEIVLMVAAMVGFMAGLGRFLEGWALTLVVVAGVVAVAALLGYLGAGRQIYGWSLKPVVIGREAIALTLAACGGLAVMLRRPRESFPAFGKGVLWGVIGIVLIAALWFAAARTANLNAVIRFTGGAVLAGVCLGCLAASVHYLIRAFEMGRINDRGGALTK